MPVALRHAVDVVGRRLGAHEDDRPAGVRRRHRGLGRRRDLAAGDARATRASPVARATASPRSATVSGGFASRPATRRTASSRVSGKSGSSAMSTGDPQGRLRAALADPDLEHPEPALLDRELDVAEVGVVALERVARSRAARAATSGIRSSSTEIGSVRWVPATTSSPWASNITSP